MMFIFVCVVWFFYCLGSPGTAAPVAAPARASPLWRVTIRADRKVKVVEIEAPDEGSAVRHVITQYRTTKIESVERVP